MKVPNFWESVLIALIAATLSALGFPALIWLLGYGAVNLGIAGIAGAYLIYLLARSPEPVGRLVSLSIWIGISGLALFFSLSPTAFSLMQLGMISIFRALYFQGRLLGILGDLLLTAVATVAGLGAWLHTGSWFLAVWTLFLVQSFFIFFPVEEKGKRSSLGPEDPFEAAHRQAEAALRKLSESRN